MTGLTDSPSRILIVRPSALGDVARTVPALVSLRRAYPDAEIDWLVNDRFVDVIAHHPALSRPVPFPRRRFQKFGRSPTVTRQVFHYLADLRRRRYDAVYDLQGLSRSGWLTWATRAPKRIGPADARELGWLAYTRRCRIDPVITHTVDRMLAVIECGGVETVRDMRLYIGDTDAAWADAYLAEHDLEPERFAVLAPTAAWPSKRWPIERFNRLADRLDQHGFHACVILGSPGEEDQAAPLFESSTPTGPRRLDLVGRTTVGQMMAILRRCGLLVANDSAALHIAVGLGRRAVSIFGPTDPSRVGPYRYTVGVVRAGGGHVPRYRAVKAGQGLIGSVGVDEADAAVGRVLRSPPPRSIPPQPEPAPAAV